MGHGNLVGSNFCDVGVLIGGSLFDVSSIHIFTNNHVALLSIRSSDSQAFPDALPLLSLSPVG